VEERKIMVCQKVLDILDKNSINVELRVDSQDEVNGNLGVGIAHQICQTFVARETNICLFGKLVWDLVQYTDKLWVRPLSHKYTGGHHFLHTEVHSSSSPSWSSIIRGKNSLKQGYVWCAGSGSSSFWFSNWSNHGFLGAHVPIIDIHNLHLSVKDVLSTDGSRTQALNTNLPPDIANLVNTIQFRFNDSIIDVVIWGHNKNDTYTAKSGYAWLLSQSGTPNLTENQLAWNWIWKLKAPEKYKFL
jgi:hypothetical protein